MHIDLVDNIKGIIRYGNSTADPTTSAYDYSDSCEDEDSSNLVPYLAIAASNSDVEETTKASIEVADTALLWRMGATSFVSQWDYPTTLQVLEGNDTWSDEQRVIQLPEADQWVYMIISSAFATDHPIHLHGHDFWVLAQGYGTWTNDTSSLTLQNAPRRDVAMLPASGYLVVAFKTDNPGVSMSTMVSALSLMFLPLHLSLSEIRTTNAVSLMTGLADALPYCVAHE